MGTAFTNSLGLHNDVRKMLETSCDIVPGHAWDPSKKLDWWTEGTVPGHPACKDCQKQWVVWMSKHGLTRTQLNRLLKMVGAPKVYDPATAKPSSGGQVTSTELLALQGHKMPLCESRRIRERKALEKAKRQGGFDRNKPEPKLKDTLPIPVLDTAWTAWHEQENERIEQLRDDVLEQRAQALESDPTLDRNQLAYDFPFPKDRKYRPISKEEMDN